MIHVCDLRFKDGILDENYVYNHVRYKQNIYVEISLLKNALLPYRNALRNMNQTNDVQHQELIVCSKQYYNMFVEKKTKNIVIINDVLGYFGIGEFDNCENVFFRKLVEEKENKLKEFNFKVLNNILPCNYNLHKWKIRNSEMCDVCSNVQTIAHLLFYCPYVKPIWGKISQAFDIQVDIETILGFKDECIYNSVFTLTSYIIYKEWLLLSLENKTRNQACNLKMVKSELELRIKIYKSCKTIPLGCILQLEHVLSGL